MILSIHSRQNVVFEVCSVIFWRLFFEDAFHFEPIVGWCFMCDAWPTCQPPEYKNLETSRNLCIVRMSLKTMFRNNL